jgi:hypothetical protein
LINTIDDTREKRLRTLVVCMQMSRRRHRTFVNIRSFHFHTCFNNGLHKIPSQFLKLKANSFIMSSLIKYLCLTKVYWWNVLYIRRLRAFLFTLKLSWILRKRSDMHTCADVFLSCHYRQFIQLFSSFVFGVFLFLLYVIFLCKCLYEHCFAFVEIVVCNITKLMK